MRGNGFGDEAGKISGAGINSALWVCDPFSTGNRILFERGAQKFHPAACFMDNLHGTFRKYGLNQGDHGLMIPRFSGH